MQTSEASPALVLWEISDMLSELFGEYRLVAPVEITMATTFQGDLELESIDFVALAGLLQARYGSQVNFAEFIAAFDVDEIIGLTVGRLVDYVVACLRCGQTVASGGKR